MFFVGRRQFSLFRFSELLQKLGSFFLGDLLFLSYDFVGLFWCEFVESRSRILLLHENVVLISPPLAQNIS